MSMKKVGKAGSVQVLQDQSSGVFWLEHKGSQVSYEAAISDSNPWDDETCTVAGKVVPVWEQIHDLCDSY